jgi:UPF0176 protein
LLYYKYTHLEDAPTLAEQHLDFCKNIGLKGRVLLAYEGMNGTVSGTPEQCQAYIHFIESDPRFAGIEWKKDDSEEISFLKMHVRFRPELVSFYDKDYHYDPNRLSGKYLEPAEFLAMKDEEDVVVLDTRNRVEWEMGKFNNALTLEIESFRELTERVDELKEKIGDKKILAYCTGGIRCEKATAFLLEKGFKEVYHLHGGIVNYGKQVGGKDFDGYCYVFDGRIGVPVNTVNPKIITQCLNCGDESLRMVNCANPHCNAHFVQCFNCGKELKGACSTQCSMAPNIRPFNEKGYFAKKGH